MFKSLKQIRKFRLSASFLSVTSLALTITIILPLQIRAETTMPVPISQQSFFYKPIFSPVINTDQALAQPVGVGSVATGEYTLSIKVEFPQFSGPVDVYLAVYAPAIDPNVWVIKPDLSLQRLSEGLVKWRENIVGPVDESLYGDISPAFLALPLGTYYLYAAVAPTASTSAFYLWQTYFVVAACTNSISPTSNAVESGCVEEGVKLDATITPTYNGTNTSSVDAFQDICPAATATAPAEYEKITDHQATVTITATLLNPNPQIAPGTLYIDKYTVEYRRSQDSIGAPPIESDTRYDTIIITPPQSGTDSTTTTFTAIFVDLIRKAKYASDTLSGAYSFSTLAYLNNYTATYTFVGHNQYGKSFSFMAQVDFQIGDFNNCQ